MGSGVIGLQRTPPPPRKTSPPSSGKLGNFSSGPDPKDQKILVPREESVCLPVSLTYTRTHREEHFLYSKFIVFFCGRGWSGQEYQASNGEGGSPPGRGKLERED